MSILKIAAALPLVVGIACSTSGAQSSDHTGAMWSERKASAPEASAQGTASSGAQDASVVLTAAGSSDGKSSSDSGSMGSGSSDSSGSMGSGSMGSGSTGSGSGDSGGSMGSGGSAETMGSAPEQGGSAGSTGSSDTGSSASGSSAMGAAGGPGEAAHGDEWVHGKVSKVSKDEVTITPKKGETRTLKIGDQTVVTINGKTAKASQLKKGQQVRAAYSNENGEDVATKIMVGRARQARGHMKDMMKDMKGGSAGSSGSESGSSGGSGSESK